MIYSRFARAKARSMVSHASAASMASVASLDRRGARKWTTAAREASSVRYSMAVSSTAMPFALRAAYATIIAPTATLIGVIRTLVSIWPPKPMRPTDRRGGAQARARQVDGLFHRLTGGAS